MSWISLTVKDIALGAGPHVMWWLLEGIEPSFDARLSPGGGFRRAAEEKNGRKNDHLEPRLRFPPLDLQPSLRHPLSLLLSPGPAFFSPYLKALCQAFVGTNPRTYGSPVEYPDSRTDPGAHRVPFPGSFLGPQC